MKTTNSIYDLRFTIYERLSLALVLFSLLLPGLAPSSHAAGPPEAMAYQGFLVDANGNPLAPTTPANYPVIFKIYATSTGGASLWSEQQIVTVDKGNFSVILSEGTPVGSDPKPPLSTVVSTNGADRYIELSVTIGAAPPAPMLPRLRLLPMAYAFLATSANNLVSPTGVPVVRYANNRVEVTGDLSFSGGLSGNAAGLSGLTAAQIGTGTFSDARLSANVALRAGGNTFTGNQTISGSVGIGGTPVDAALDVEGNLRLNLNDIFLREGTDRNHGLGWYGTSSPNKPFAGVNVDGPVLYGFSGGGLGTKNGGDKMVLKWDATGKVGIGNSSPFRLLDVGSSATPNTEGMIRMASRSGAGGANRVWDIGVPETDEVISGEGYSFVIDDAQTAGTEFMVKWGTGNVGIGTTAPVAKLDVNGSARVNGNVQALGNVTVGTGDARIAYAEATPDTLEIIAAGGLNRKVKIWSEGGATVVGKLDLTGPTSLTMGDSGYNGTQGNIQTGPTSWTANPNFGPGIGIEVYSEGGAGSFPNGHTFTAPVSLRADGWIATARGFVAYSDRRIKRDTRHSEAAKDLAAIEKLRVTEYRMVDPADGGTAWRKGFIAQEVEEVIPGAVSRSLEFVPDIFSLSTNTVFDGTTKTLALSLSKEHGLKTGERVRLHVDGTRFDANVTAVPSAHEFVVEKCDRQPGKVFVYGRQVSDFRTVDYDRVFTTGIGAIQELAGKVQALESAQKRIAQLEADASAATTRHQREMADLQREIALLKNRPAQSALADTLRSELDDLKKAVQQLAAGRSAAKTAALAPEPPLLVPAGSDTSATVSTAAR